MPLNPGQILQQRYRIDALLGQGGMGTVYRATDLNLGIPVVVKENLIHSSEAKRQFEREARILAAMRHPNLPRVSDHFFIPGQGQYLVMDYVEGEDLNQIIARSGTIPETQALAWIGQILDALAYLHSRQIIHRDVKPANVKITPQGQVYLVDFGLAKVYDLYQRTSTGARGVTPGYAPPEQYGQGRTDTRSDVYAVGATLYTALTGQVPPDSVDLMVGSEILSPPRQSNPSISPQTEQAVLKAMEPRPTDRFQTTDGLGDALSKPTPTRQLPGRRPGPVPVPSGRRRLPVGLWVVGGVLLALAVALGAWLWLGPGSGGNPEPTGAAIAAVAVTPTMGAVDVAESSPEPSATATATASLEPEPTETWTPTSIPVLIESSTLTPAATITTVPTQTPTVAPTMTPSPALTPTARPTEAPAPTATAASPPARNQIAYTSRRDGNYDIYVANTDSSDERRLTSDPGRDQSPTWSPDGRRIAFSSERDGNRGIFVMNADGTGMQRLTTGYHSSPAWSPDGKQIALDNGYVVNADGSGLRRMEGFSGSPAWSPDGRQIAYSKWSREIHSRLIWVADSDGANKRQLTFQRLETGTTDGSPAWSPDGQQIAFGSNGDGVWGIYIINADGSGYRRLTDHGDRAAAPAWSPDGKRIAFSASQDGTTLIYVMNADGSGLQYLAQGTEPAWSP